MLKLLRRIARFRSDLSGAATVEFVLIFPVFFMFFINSAEIGYYMVRNVMLERGVDVAVRQVRLGGASAPDFDGFKKIVCDNVGGVLPDCTENLMVSMEVVPGGTDWVAGLSREVSCLDKKSEIEAKDQASYASGGQNELMVVRVCALSQPMFPTTRFGLKMAHDEYGNVAIVALSSFVNEPA